MKKIIIQNGTPVFGLEVKTFPLGIGETFEKLVKMLPGGFDRSFYGISYMKNGKMIYYAAAEEKNDGEAEKYGCEQLMVEKGEWLIESINNWRSKTDCIKDVFMEMMKDENVDKTKPAVEWYMNDKEMVCMLKSKKYKEQ